MKYIGSVVLVHIVLNVLVCWLKFMEPYTDDRWWSPLGLVWIAPLLLVLGHSQGALLGFWIALGRRHTPWRVLLASVGVIAYLWCLSELDALAKYFHMPFAWSTCLIAVLLFIGRVGGVSIVVDDSSRLRRPQCTLMDVFVWMTTFAIVFAAIDWRSIPAYLDKSLGTVGIFAAVSLASLWAVLGRKWLSARVLTVFMAITTGATIVMLVEQRLEGLAFGLVLAVHTGWIVGSLFFVRRAGYRLMWQWRWGG